jgi:hypothetical protein
VVATADWLPCIFNVGGDAAVEALLSQIYSPRVRKISLMQTNVGEWERCCCPTCSDMSGWRNRMMIALDTFWIKGWEDEGPAFESDHIS